MFFAISSSRHDSKINVEKYVHVSCIMSVRLLSATNSSKITEPISMQRFSLV
jgi:hypothetical protein